MNDLYLVTWQRADGDVLYWVTFNEHGEGWTFDRQYASSMTKTDALMLIEELEKSNLPHPMFIEVPA